MSTHTYTVAGHAPVDLDRIAAELRATIDGLPPGEPKLAHHLLTNTLPVKTALVVIRGEELPHVHPGSDLIVTVLEGGGFVQLTSNKVEASLGGVVLIPKDTCHAYHNTSPTDSVLLATFSPSAGSEQVRPCPAGT